LENSTLLDKAIQYATITHEGQIRRNGEPYINHVLRVKALLESAGITDETTLVVAVLHASLDFLTFDEIKREFSEEIANLLVNLDEISKTPIPISEDRSDARIASLHKLFIQLSRDIRALIVRLADRVDNIKTADGFNTKEREWIAKNAISIYAPIAKAVGIYAFTRELENGALKILEPDRYKFIEKFLDHRFKNSERDLILAKHKISEFLKSQGEENFEITFRKKSIFSTNEKALSEAKKGDIASINDLDGLYDLLGIRILVDNEQACYSALAYLQSEWKMIAEELDDYISKPKKNGYKTLQTAIWLKPDVSCEVQMRTFEMHEVNEYGPASHFNYKYAKGSVKKQSSDWIKNLIDLKDGIQTSLANNSQIKLFEDTIFVFTPKQDLITLPKDATPVDFAYAVHTQIGNRCAMAKVNAKLVALSAKLKSGDTVEIITEKNHKPSARWLETVKSKEAHDGIMKAMR
jgi:guanosine-3',5'-bis(diphosphate) 3'-pyrophosphohydrolase